MATRKAPAPVAAPSRKRMIEDEIPLAEVNYHSSKEKKHPRRFVELIHQWPARRPRSASRVAIAAALLSAPATEAEKQDRLNLLKELAPYECSKTALEKARALIRAEHGGRAPKVLDLFAGGGAIPLEAANLGCEAYAVELNPVAHIIELATCVYPQKYGPRLADLVEEWGQKVLKEVRARIGDLYPPIRIPSEAKLAQPTQQLAFAHGGSGGSTEKVVEPIAYLWTRTAPCTDKKCGAVVPLVRQTWLCRKSDRAIALRVVPDRAAKKVRFDIVSADSPAELDFDPADHSDRGDAECPFCGATISAREVKECGKVGKLGTQLMALVGLVAGTRGRVYLPADAVALPSASDLAKRLSATGEEWPGVTGLQMPLHDSLNFKLPLYGVSTFDAMFSDRQTIAMLEFSAAIRRAYDSIADEVHDDELAKAVVTYLAISLDKLADNCCMYATWESTDQIVKHTFSQQVLKMIWDFAEVNPFENVAGSFLLALKSVALAAKGLASSSNPATCIRASATDLDLPDDTFDGVITDPPYYDNISYADLSDFFYVWLKRTLGVLYPEHFRGEQTPKKQEATVTPPGGSQGQTDEVG